MGWKQRILKSAGRDHGLGNRQGVDPDHVTGEWGAKADGEREKQWRVGGGGLGWSWRGAAGRAEQEVRARMWPAHSDSRLHSR